MPPPTQPSARGGQGGQEHVCLSMTGSGAPHEGMPLLPRGGGGGAAADTLPELDSSVQGEGGVVAASDTVTLTKSPSERMGIDVLDVEQADGRICLRLRRVAKDSPADRAGCARYIGWNLVAINGSASPTLASMRAAGLQATEVSLGFSLPTQPDVDSDAESELMDVHPQLAETDEQKAEKKEKRANRATRPKGGDSVASRHSEYVAFLLIPVSVTMFAAVVSTQLFDQIKFFQGTLWDSKPVSVTSFAGNTEDSDSSSVKFGGALLNAAIITGLIVVMTALFVCLYKLRCMAVMMCWLGTSTALVLIGVSILWVERVSVRYQIPLDWLTLCMLSYNFAAVGLTCIYYRGHPSLTRAYHIATSAVVAWYMTRLPEWTTWCLLITVALYDIFAVFCGPLKVLVEESVRRDEPIPALVYESRRYKLGLGDFVFYSLLVARAASIGFVSWCVAFVGVLMGMCLTLFGLAYFSVPLPALPCSIFIGVAMAFSARYIVEAYVVETFVVNGAYI